jgi:hypothetical protein
MKSLCEDLVTNVPEIVRTWEELLERQPWFLRPKGFRDDTLPEVVLGLISAALCEPACEEVHRKKVQAAAAMGWSRRVSGLPEHVMFTEFHVLRQAIWYYLERRYGLTEEVSQAIFRIDAALSLATNASMWGYHRSEIEALGKWEEGITRIIRSSPFLQPRASGVERPNQRRRARQTGGSAGLPRSEVSSRNRHEATGTTPSERSDGGDGEGPPLGTRGEVPV